MGLVSTVIPSLDELVGGCRILTPFPHLIIIIINVYSFLFYSYVH